MSAVAGGHAVLAIVERANRGALEKQFFDAGYLASELHRQLGGLDVVLRGAAACYAVPADEHERVVLGGRSIDTLSTPRADLSVLLDLGVGVFVDPADLDALGMTGRPLLLGVTTCHPADLARRWPSYRTVCFL